MKRKLLAITIGQSPRNDILFEVEKYMTNFEIIQKGALDGLTKKYIEENLYIESDSYVLESKLNNGDHVSFAEEKILPLIQKILDKNDNEVDQVLMLCTGVFNHKFRTRHNIIYPQKIIHPIVKAIIGNGNLVVLNPNKNQLKQSEEKWSQVVENVKCSFVSPYANDENEFKNAVKFINENSADLVLLDCMGYNEEMKNYFIKQTNKPVILSNALVGKVLSEL